MEPLLVINGGDEYTTSKEVSLTILAMTAKEIMLANDAVFTGVSLEAYTTSKTWILLTGDGQKTVYMKVKYDSTESKVVKSSIYPEDVSNVSLSIGTTDSSNTLDVVLHIQADAAVKMMISNDSLFSGAEWEDFSPTKSWHLDFSKAIASKAKVYVKFKNDFDMETASINDEIFLTIISGIKINNNEAKTSTRTVTLNLFSKMPMK